MGIATNGDESIEADGKLADYGPRVDCLRELVTYHRIGGLTGPAAKPVDPRPDWGPDPLLGNYRKAVQLLDEADELRRSQRYDMARQNCDEALLLRQITAAHI